MLDIDPLYMIYALVAASAIMFGEGAYLLLFSATSYRKRINHRLALLSETNDRESILIQLRRERGLTGGGDLTLPILSFNRLLLQSGMSGGLPRLAIYTVIVTLMAFTLVVVLRDSMVEGVLAAIACLTLGPILALKMMRSRRQKKFGTQFGNAIDIIVRSLRAGHPVPIAVTMVARELPDPVGTEFGIVADEITYGADLETAMRNLFYRVGQDDLPLFVTAVAIQGSTGGNLGEILENLSSVIRDRFKMRRKIKALASEGKMSAILLSALPIGMFFIVQVVSPDFYGSVWKYDLTKLGLGLAAAWMVAGNLLMFRMVNFKV
ncbi:MAG: type II secretion system F family protein [Rhodoplanes sp.]|uniref:type II secretion system F family protein n=1 Tax=Rhodoplanes sp. TaxID=1968906 RepID=UPI0018497E24|nr:type II secretion system F family protein [Rhodoplanes sp.]NVO16567.1 type II secretion system F family protein [Rhodoplanes sp.]